MGRYFGTDGVRGETNVELTPGLAFKLGRFGSYVLSQHEAGRPKVFVVRDIRIPEELLESALVTRLLSVGIEVCKLGVLATPGVSYLVHTEKTSAGVMISASRNLALNSGIRFFGGDDFKLADDQEDEIEALLDAPEDTFPRPSAEGLGTLVNYPEGLRKYEESLASTGVSLEGIKVVLDTTNGTASVSAHDVFLDLDAGITVVGGKPDGLNINDDVGPTHPEQLQESVKGSGAAVGLTFDGDSDCLIAVDESDNIVDGDKVMYIIGKYLSERGQLAHNTIITTVMSNLGFHKALGREGINKAITAVDDRYVVEEMHKSGYSLGDEQSSRVIILDYNITDDGQLTAIQLIKAMKETGKSLSELAAGVTIYPQKLVNVRVENGMEGKTMEVPPIADIINKMEAEMNGNDRILVRPGSTEPLLRAMAEAPTDKEVSYYVDTIADIVRKEIGID